MLQDADNSDDGGGTVKLYYGPSSTGPWTLFNTAAWSETMDWGPIDAFHGQYLRGSETGNGSTYAPTEVFSESILCP
jgi:Neuraminidase (sialidase)